MPINVDRFARALDLLEPTDWRRFERLCNAFLVSEFGELLRSTANPSGDGGRDAELYSPLYSPVGRANVLFQYSVQGDWRSKIKETITRLDLTRRREATLYFVSSLEIGALADDLIGEYRGRPTIVVRDREWFCPRANLDENRTQAAREFTDAILASIGSKDSLDDAAATLTSDESRTLLFYLEIQRDDEQQGRNLTKSSHEAIVRAALRETSASNFMGIDGIYERVGHFLPQYDLNRQLKPYIDTALKRLVDKQLVKFNKKANGYHLSHEEKERLTEKKAEIISLRHGFLKDVDDVLSTDARVEPDEREKMCSYIARSIELYLHHRGEAFASAVLDESSNLMDDDDELINAIAKTSPTPRLRSQVGAPFVCRAGARILLRTPGDRTLAYLKILSDCYTLFAFLAATPDVQAATKKLFSSGEIWLDTSAILPALAEWGSDTSDAFDSPFTLLYEQLKASGLKRYVTSGVIEEILSHLHNCVAYSRNQNWRGGVPYVASQYLIRGGARSGIAGFVDEFRGDHKPEEDLAEFLNDSLGIMLFDPPAADNVPAVVCIEVMNYFQEASAQRHPDLDPLSVLRLAKHDAENYVNALSRRSESAEPWRGYTSWWLALDGLARKLLDGASPETKAFIRHQPIISLDFLTRYLTFGPLRANINRHMTNPLELYSHAVGEIIPAELVQSARDLRSDLGSLSERKKRRRITAAIDQQRADFGVIHAAGLENVAATIRTQSS